MLLNKIFNFLYKCIDYKIYRWKYQIGSGFQFNGYGTRIVGDGELFAGQNSYISYNSHIVLVKGAKLVIGNDVSISHFVKIYTSGFCTERKILFSEYVEIIGDVIIGDNVLIGSGCFICPNVTIGSNVIIGANSVVTKDIPSNGVYAGSPAKLIKYYEQS